MMNVGNSLVTNIQVNFNENFLQLLTPRTIRMIQTISAKTIYLKPNESKLIQIGIVWKRNDNKKKLERNLGTGEMATVVITDEQIERIKTTPIEITGSYQTIGKTVLIKESFCLGDWTGLFISQPTVTRELSEINNSLSRIAEKM